MKLFVQIILVILFLLQGTNTYNAYVIFLLILLLATNISIKSIKFKLPNYYTIAVLIYLFYLGIGLSYSHIKPTIDIKFQIFSFIFYFWLLNQRYKIDFLKLLFIINIIVFIIYILLKLKLMPSLWSENAVGFKGRIYGPAITAFILIGFYYLYRGLKFDWKFGVSAALALSYTAITTNFMNLGIAVGMIFLVIINFKRFFNPIYFSVIGILIVCGIVYLQSSLVPELVQTKLKYVFRPWEYSSLRIRISDLQKAFRSENFTTLENIFGKGFGASTRIFRDNKIAVSFRGYYTFQEIDNGFYYIFHRGGVTLMTIFLLSHAYLTYRIPNLKAKLGFILMFIMTNLLSIHYFNYFFYLLIPFVILTKDNQEK